MQHMADRSAPNTEFPSPEPPSDSPKTTQVVVRVARRSMFDDPAVARMAGAAGIILVLVLLVIVFGSYFGFLFSDVPQTRDEVVLANWKAAVEQDGSSVDQHQSYVLALITAGDYAVAEQQIALIEGREDFDPAQAQNALFLKAEVARARGELDKALEMYTEAMELMDEAYEEKRAEGGETNWALAYGRHENYYISALARAGIYIERGDDAEALEMLDLYLANRADEPGLMVQRGEVKARLGDTQGAAEDFRRALTFIPDMPEALEGLDSIGAER